MSDTRAFLLAHAAAYPALTLTDLFKALYQSAFGCEHLVADPSAAEAYIAAEAEGVRLSLLSDYALTGGGAAPVGTLVLGYGSLADESCPAVGETLKRACTAARESSVRV